MLHLLNPTTLQRAELPAAKYFRSSQQLLEAVMSSKDLVQFEVHACVLCGCLFIDFRQLS